MERANKNIMIIAGEASGDLHGASLMEEMKQIDSSICFLGVGGDKMIAAGLNAYYHINQMAFLGFVEVIKHIPFVKKVQKDLLRSIQKNNIKTAILIDYPGFNLNFAKKIKKFGVKTVYYISPQIWAWGKGRIHKIKRLIDKMIVLFKFEETIYKEAGVASVFVGHPLLDRVKEISFGTKEEFCKVNGFDCLKDILLILPGSRKQEIEKIFPEAITAANRIANEMNMQIAVACSPNIDQKIFDGLSEIKSYKVIKTKTYELFRFSKIGIIKSGTSTLEAGLFGMPMAVVYKTNLLTYLIGKALIKIDKIALINIIAGEKIVPELIQKNASAKNIYETIKALLTDQNKFDSMKNNLLKAVGNLGVNGASKRAAEIITNL